MIDFILKKPKIAVIIFTLITILISSQALGIKITSNMEVYMPSREPTVETLNDIREEWPMDSIIIYVSAENVTKVSTLKEILAVESAINPRNDDGKEDGIVYTVSIASLIEEMRGTLMKMISEKMPLGIGEDFFSSSSKGIPENQKIVDFSLGLIPDEMKYRFISKDHKNAIIMAMVTPSAAADAEGLIDSIKPIVQMTSKTGETEMKMTGTVPVYQEAIDWSYGWVGKILPLSIILIFLALFFFHRNFKVVFIVAIPIIYALGLTFGTLGLLPIKFVPQLLTVMSLLLALGIAYSLHLVNHYAEEVDENTPEEAMKKVIPTTGKAVFLSAITTIAGFASFMTSHMPPIVWLGFAFIIGIFYCFLSTMILVPSLIIILNYRKKRAVKGWEKISKVVHHRRKIALIFGILIIISLIAAPYIQTEVNMMQMIPEDMEGANVMKGYSEKFESGNEGAFFVEVHRGDVLEPKVLEEMISMEKLINGGVENASAYSIADVIKQLNWPSNRIPKDRDKVMKIVNLLGEKEKRMMLNKDRTKALVMVIMPMMSLSETDRAVKGVQEVVDSYGHSIPGGSVSLFTGMGAITVALNDMMMSEQITSMGIALLLVFLCLLVVFRSFRYALFTALPLLIILLLEPGSLVLFNIPLNVVTIMVSSVVIGVGIDFCVHITQRTRDEIGKGKNAIEAIKTAVNKKSPSLIEATVTLIAGCLPIFLINLLIVSQFMFLILLLLSLACLISLTVLPGLYAIKDGKWLEKWGK